PFFTAPERIRRSASRDIEIDPRAIASRAVTGLSPTSTILTRPRASTWDSALRLLTIALALRQEERQALERHRQVDALQLHVGRHLQRAGRKIQHRLDAGGDHLPEHVLRRRRRHGDDGDADPFAPGHFLQVVDVVDRDAAARLLADFLFQRVEQRRDLEPFEAEAGIVGEGEAEVAGAHDRDAQLAIEAEDLAQVALQIADVVTDAAHAELAEVREVLPYLRGVEVELLRERLRGDGADAGVFELA